MSNALQNTIASLGSKLDAQKKGAALQQLPVADLIPYSKQARVHFDQDALKELAESIKDLGIQQPLLARPVGDGKFEIIAGERRWRAAQLVGLERLPVMVKPMDDNSADKVHLAENIHRENLSTLELAQRVLNDIDGAGGDLGVVSIKYNKSKAWLSKLASIARGGETTLGLISEGVTADRAVLATVSSLEAKAPEKAKELVLKLKNTDASKRAVAESFVRKHKPKTAQLPASTNRSWRAKPSKIRPVAAAKIEVELSPMSEFSEEFIELKEAHGMPTLCLEEVHGQPRYVFIRFGDIKKCYPAEELRLLAVK